MAISYESKGRGLIFTDESGNEHIGRTAVIEESVSTPFVITGRFLSDNFDPESQLGKKLSCTLYRLDGDKQKVVRNFNGHITAIQQLDRFDEFDQLREYEVTLRPWLWLLRFSQKNRIFQKQSLADMLQKIFSDAGFNGCFSTKGLPSTKRAFCMQYNETDYDFVHRMLAEQGVNYYFDHGLAKHNLNFQLVSSPFATGKVAKLGLQSSAQGKMPTLDSWKRQWQAQGNSVKLSGYDFTTGKAVVGALKKTTHKMANASKLSLDCFPVDSVKGDFSDLSSDLAEIALNQLNSEYNKAFVESSNAELQVASLFKLGAHPDSSQLGDYAIIRMRHQVEASEQSVTYQNTFTCIPKTDSFAPQKRPKPRIYGYQTAQVAGKTAGEPQHDADGNIKIQFHWDTEGGDNPSCYVRVAQVMTGNGAGIQFIPRAGEEVLVSFINNDPDQPVVVGSLYNGTHKPPYPKANSSQVGIKTQPSATSNELRFDDEKDNEQFYLRAAKDMLTEVENDITLTVKGKQTETVEKEITITTKEDYSLTSKKNMNKKAEEMTLEADENITLKVGDNSIEISTSGIVIKGSELTLKANGNATVSATNVKLSSTNNTDIDATTNLNLKGVNVKMDGMAGVKIGSNGRFEASGMAGAELKSMAMTSVQGTAMAEVKGALVKVN